MSNPLLDKFEELYGSPKGETTEDTGLQKLKEVVTKAMNRPITTYDQDTIKQSFLDVADKIRQGKATVLSSNIQFDADAMGTISFTVML